MRCLLLSGEMNGRVWEVRYSPCATRLFPRGNPPRLGPLHYTITTEDKTRYTDILSVSEDDDLHRGPQKVSPAGGGYFFEF